MSGLTSNSGALQVKAQTKAGRVVSAQILSPRSPLTSRVFLGRRATEAALLAGQLFSLCPVAQSLAAQACVEAAQGFLPDETQRRRRLVRLLCERLGEMLRASVLDWPSSAPPDAASLAALRLAVKDLRVLALESDGGQLAEVRRAAEILGLFGEAGPLAQQLKAADADVESALQPRPVDTLTPHDDAQVAEMMAAAPDDFARAPALPGRIVETGASARQGVAAPAGLAQRLACRFLDMRGAFDQLEALLHGGETPGEMLATQSANGWGFAAVESARGRLFHQVRLDGEGKIACYAIVAPTEWNFHPDGPFMRQILGAEIGVGAAAQDRLARLALVFDPCVPVQIEIASLADESLAYA